MHSLLMMHREFLPGRNELATLAAHAARMNVAFARLSQEHQVNDSASRFFGRGLEFEELRAYQPGDDVRTIDWRATARTGRPHVKKYREDRQQVLMLALEVRESMLFGSGCTSKCAQAVRVAALLAYAMKHGNHRIGILLWGDFGTLILPPAAAAESLNRLLDALAGGIANAGADTDWARHLETMPRGRKLVLISDFIQWQASDWHLLGRLRQRHECCAVHISDPREQTMPDVGLARITDMAGAEMMVIDSSRQSCRDAYANCWQAHMETLRRHFAEAAMPLRCVSTGDAMSSLTQRISGLMT